MARLKTIAEESSRCDWQSIANKLGTGRTPVQCLQIYQRSLNPKHVRGLWTLEEDEKLTEAVKATGAGGGLRRNWQAIAALVPGRNPSQCSLRWDKVLGPKRKEYRAKWSEEENERLRLAVGVYGPRLWKKVANFVPGRTDVQCRERWVSLIRYEAPSS